MPTDHANASAFVDYASKYLKAFGDISDESDRLPARVHIIGHCTELALKGYLAATAGKWPPHHDLKKLARKAIKNGLILSDKEANDVIPKLAKRYYQPGKSKWNHPSRYPITGMSVWVESSRDELTALIESITSQTESTLCMAP